MVGLDVGVVDPGDINRVQWVVVNLLTFAMDATAALIAHALTRPRPRGGRSWPITLPIWVASGLLSVIMLVVPFTCLGAVVGGQDNPFSGDDFLRGWVYAVVYGGFIVEGAVLLGAFVLYAHERWGGFLRARVRKLPGRASAPIRTAATAAATLLAAAGVL
ncbi:MAG: hypothetical protein HOV68_23120, partial [Streptomycetaceae bacterium]|nr:hypothetical protein [Streptomycetaceae bacterium]